MSEVLGGVKRDRREGLVDLEQASRSRAAAPGRLLERLLQRERRHRAGSDGHPSRPTNGAVHLFHCVEIADGTRTIDVGAEVTFDVMVKFGAEEAANLRPLFGSVTELEQRIVAVLVVLGEGEVVSYGDVAHDAGFPGRARCGQLLLAGTDLEPPWRRCAATGASPPIRHPARRRCSARKASPSATAASPTPRSAASAAADPVLNRSQGQI